MENKKDWVILLIGFLGALKLLLLQFGVTFITDDMVESFVACLSFGAALYGVWKNTYVSKKAQEQLEALKEKGLK